MCCQTDENVFLICWGFFYLHVFWSCSTLSSLGHRTTKQTIFWNWDLYIIWKISIEVWFVRIGQYLDNYLIIFNLRVQKNIEKFLAMHITEQKLSLNFFCGRKFTKYFHGIWSLLDIIMFFAMKEKWIILLHTMCCWLLLQTYPCYLWLLLWSRVTCYLQWLEFSSKSKIKYRGDILLILTLCHSI